MSRRDLEFRRRKIKDKIVTFVNIFALGLISVYLRQIVISKLARGHKSLTDNNRDKKKYIM